MDLNEFDSNNFKELTLLHGYKAKFLLLLNEPFEAKKSSLN